MDPILEIEIIELTKKKVLKYGSCSLRHSAEELAHKSISLSEQKKLAKLLVRSHPFITEINNGEVFVKLNTEYINSKDTTEDEYKNLKYLIGLLAAALSYLLLHVFLPGLKLF